MRKAKARKGQNWSADALVAITIFLVVLLSFFYITGRTSQSKKIDSIAEEAASIPEAFSTSPNQTLVFIEGNKVDAKRLEELSRLDYKELKRQLGISNDFCIHFEDEKGNIIFINGTTQTAGIGSGKAGVGNLTCG